MSGEKWQIEWIELAKIISMLLVVFHHSMPNYTGIAYCLNALASTVHFPALATFFFCSGYLSTGWEKKGYAGYIRNRAGRLLIPWLVISLLMLVPKAMLASDELRRSLLSLGELGWMLLDPHGRGIMPHLWFLPALFLISLAVPLVDQVTENRKISCILLFLLLLAASIPTDMTTILCLNEIRMYLLWFVLGFLVHRTSGEVKLRKDRRLIAADAVCVIITLLMIFLGTSFSYSRIVITISGFFGILCTSVFLEEAMKALVRFFSGKTMCVYLWSMCAQNFVEVIFHKVGLNGNLAFLLMFLTGILVPLLMYEVVTCIEKSSGRELKSARSALGI